MANPASFTFVFSFSLRGLRAFDSVRGVVPAKDKGSFGSIFGVRDFGTGEVPCHAFLLSPLSLSFSTLFTAWGGGGSGGAKAIDSAGFATGFERPGDGARGVGLLAGPKMFERDMAFGFYHLLQSVMLIDKYTVITSPLVKKVLTLDGERLDLRDHRFPFRQPLNRLPLAREN